jgi:uncharacterized membrane protein YfcA
MELAEGARARTLATAPPRPVQAVTGHAITNALVGLLVGIASGLIGLGGAELRLPYLVGVLGLTAHRAVPVNLVISFLTILAAVPARLWFLSEVSVAPLLAEAFAIATGAIVAAWLGAGWLKALSGPALARLIFVVLVVLGIGLLAEAGLSFESEGFLPADLPARVVAGLLFGFLIGAISSVLGVAGGEVIIPTLVFGYGVPIKAAGSLSILISLPTVLAGMARHARSGAFADRLTMRGIVLPMASGSAIGAVVGSMLAVYAGGGFVKVALGLLLIWSAWTAFARHAGRPVRTTARSTG